MNILIHRVKSPHVTETGSVGKLNKYLRATVRLYMVHVKNEKYDSKGTQCICSVVLYSLNIVII